MYTLNGQILEEGQGFQDSTGKYYPANWLTYSTDAEKAAIGIIYIPVRPTLLLGARKCQRSRRIKTYLD